MEGNFEVFDCSPVLADCRFLHSCLAVGIALFVLLQAKRSMEHTEASPVCVNKSNVWAMSTEYSWSDNRKTKVFGEKFIPVFFLQHTDGPVI